MFSSMYKYWIFKRVFYYFVSYAYNKYDNIWNRNIVLKKGKCMEIYCEICKSYHKVPVDKDFMERLPESGLSYKKQDCELVSKLNEIIDWINAEEKRK